MRQPCLNAAHSITSLVTTINSRDRGPVTTKELFIFALYTLQLKQELAAQWPPTIPCRGSSRYKYNTRTSNFFIQ